MLRQFSRTILLSAFIALVSISCGLQKTKQVTANQKGETEKSLACSVTPTANPLPLPADLPLVDYQRKLYSWILQRQYADQNWCHDTQIRDTGPFVNGQYHGTHPAVFIYYSPEVMQWLLDREKGIEREMADGAMIIKEMYAAPAQIYHDIQRVKDAQTFEQIRLQQLSDWTVMVKDSGASADGWFWGSVAAPALVDGKLQSLEEAIAAQLDTRENNDKAGSFAYNNGLRVSGFGMPCLRCHASAKQALTFASLRNIQGFTGGDGPIEFLNDGSWRNANHFSKYPANLLLKDPELKALFDIPLSQLPWSTQASVKAGAARAIVSEHDRDRLQNQPEPATPPYVNKTFLKTFPQIPQQRLADIKKFPQQWLDHVVQKTGKPQIFITSDNCLGCHGGLSDDTFGVTMFLPTGPSYGEGYDISEYGEWRWSPMGLAGRDPIFHAQLESEMAAIEEDGKNPVASGLKGSVSTTQTAITNTCLSCHGAMGQRQLHIDASKPGANLDPNFKVDYFYLTEQLEASQAQTELAKQYHEYGELAREGISCMICHRVAAPDADAVKQWNPYPEQHWVNPDMADRELAYLLFHNSTGRFNTSANDTLYGPYNVSQKPMQHAVNLTPEKNPFIQTSQMCATCHTINLPNIGSTDSTLPVLQAAETNPAFKDYPHSIEQATFLEWQNSAFAAGDGAKSCQDCHMKSRFDTLDGDLSVAPLATKIATIQDNTYPEADHALIADEREVPLRTTYKRHTHVGLNAFLLNMFKQFDGILGVAEKSYMTGASKAGVDLALASMALQARDETVTMSVDSAKVKDNTLLVRVTAKNKVGHRFPSGVAFRRAFIELLVKDGDKIIWSSGRTNDAGVIVDQAGKPLSTEFFADTPSSSSACAGFNNSCYQRHHQIITSDRQVQIYEELNQDNKQVFTTSFVHRVKVVKDNRLLPDGWRGAEHFKNRGEVIYQFMQSTEPESIDKDPDYQDQGEAFVGRDSLEYHIPLALQYQRKPLTVQATMYYQAIPPYWLKQRFDQAPNGEATKRLHYLASHLKLDGTELAQWKFKLDSASRIVGQ